MLKVVEKQSKENHFQKKSDSKENPFDLNADVQQKYVFIFVHVSHTPAFTKTQVRFIQVSCHRRSIFKSKSWYNLPYLLLIRGSHYRENRNIN